MVEKIFRVLVVDDHKDWQKTLGGILREGGYDVMMVGSRIEAIAALESSPFDLAVIDVHLDEADENNVAGLDLAKEIKRRWSLIKIIFITGYPNLAKQSFVADSLKKTEIHNLIKSVQRALKR